MVRAYKCRCSLRIYQVGQPHIKVEQVEGLYERRLKQLIKREGRCRYTHDLVEHLELPVC